MADLNERLTLCGPDTLMGRMESMTRDAFWEKRRVLVFAREAGGADVVGPVVLALQERMADCLVLATGPACERFLAQGLLWKPFPDYADVAADEYCQRTWGAYPDLVFTSAASLPMLDMTEKYLWRWAASRRIPSAAILDQWQNYALRFSGPGGEDKLGYLPGQILVMDTVAFDDAVAEGLPEARLRVGGHPALDLYARPVKKETAEAVRRALRVPEETILVVFLAESLRADFGETLGYDEHTTLRFLVRTLSEYVGVQGAKSLRLLVKLHPQNHPHQFEAELTRLPFPVSVVGDRFQPSEVIQAADLITGMSSILLIHSIAADKPTVSLQLGAKGPSQMVATRTGAIPFLRDEPAARTLLLSLLQEHRSREAYVMGQKRWDLRKDNSVGRVLGHLESVICEATA